LKKLHLYITFFWIALGIFVGGYSYLIGLGKLLDPGPGLFPFTLSLVVLLLSIYKLAKELPSIEERKGESRKQKEHNSFENTGKIVILTVILFAYTYILEPLGFLLTTFLVMAALLRVAGYTQWIRIIVYAIIICVITYAGFTYLGTNLPTGILDLGLH
jgi:putative tricarboxylic transport membrane protein